jgi:myosin heavy subunit
MSHVCLISFVCDACCQEMKCKIAADKLVVLDKQCLDPEVSNLIGLSNLSENSILHNLRIRFHKECIYTFVSSILIAVNPFRQLPLYGVEIREKYLSTADKSTLPPHIFTIADNSFRAMMSDSLSQSVVISGESGAGKTESTKVLLEYIADLSSDGQDSDGSLQHQILQCNPVMEAFGNAKTVRNNNSSRFGKLITINFMSGTIKGASIIR